MIKELAARTLTVAGKTVLNLLSDVPERPIEPEMHEVDIFTCAVMELMSTEEYEALHNLDKMKFQSCVNEILSMFVNDNGTGDMLETVSGAEEN